MDGENEFRVRPVALAPGDTVAVVAPAGHVDRDALDRGVAALEGWGLRIRPGAHVLDRHDAWAGTDRDRAADLMAAFLDDRIRGIFCARGGFGSARLLLYLDLAAIGTHPKVFVGYSDVTVLHLAIARHGGWPTFYGPMVASDIHACDDVRCMNLLWRLVSVPSPAGSLVLDDTSEGIETVVPGSAVGLLTGGTLCVMETTLGTGYRPRTRGRILALEDESEQLWRVDRMFTHLHHAGLLQGAAGFVLGSLGTQADPEGGREAELAVVREQLAPLSCPAIYGFPFGHIPAPITLPLNCLARLDADSGTLTILEPAVSPA